MTTPIASHPIAATQNEEANDETSCFQHSKALRYSVPTPDHEPKQIMNPIASSPPSVHFDGFALALVQSWTSVMLTPWSPLHLVAEGLRLRLDTDGYRFSVF